MYAPEYVFSLSVLSALELYEFVYERDPRGVRRRTPPERVRPVREGEVGERRLLEPVCESPRSEADSGPRYDNEDVTIAVPEPDVTSIDSSVMRPDVDVAVNVAVPVPAVIVLESVVVVRVSVVSVSLCVNEDEE